MSATIYREYDNIALTAFLRDVPQRTGAILNRFLPDMTVTSRTFKIREGTRTNKSAVFRAWDTPSQPSARTGYTERTGSLPPLSRHMLIGEDEGLCLYERVIAGEFDDEVTAAIYDDAAVLVREVRNRMEMARGELLSTGKIDILENGLELTADFGMPVGNALTAAAVWSDTANADPLTDLRSANEQSLDENGVPIAYAIVKPGNMSNLLLNDSIRNLLSTSGVTPGLATGGQVQSLFTAHGLPTFVEYDYKVDGVSTIPAGTVVLVPEPDAEDFGATRWGPTREAQELGLDFNDAPGIVGYVMKSDDPVHVKTQVAAVGLPVLHDAKKLYTLAV